MFDLGFRHFVGVDGSKGMLECAAKTGLYQELRLALLGQQPLPAQAGKPALSCVAHWTHYCSRVIKQKNWLFCFYVVSRCVWFGGHCWCFGCWFCSSQCRQGALPCCQTRYLYLLTLNKIEIKKNKYTQKGGRTGHSWYIIQMLYESHRSLQW